MTEPKKRGRPSKADIAAREAAKACPECAQTVGHYDECPVGLGVGLVSMTTEQVVDDIQRGVCVMLSVEETARQVAQAYAMRVWNGQSIDAPRAWRIERVKQALEGQNLPFDGVILPD